MDREDCGCLAKGRLRIHVESKLMKQVRIMIQEENNYRDFYTIYIKDGHGNILIDNIAEGYLKIETNMDDKYVIYEPSNIILFSKNNYIHKLNIVDRRKKSD